MKHLALVLLLLSFCSALSAQSIPVKFVTVFKSGKSMVTRAGKVPVKDHAYNFSKPPEALFGTYWATAPGGELVSVSSKIDSIAGEDPNFSKVDIFKNNLHKPLNLVAGTPPNTYELKNVTCEKASPDCMVFKTQDGRWITLSNYIISSFEFVGEPSLNFPAKTFTTEKRLSFRFKSASPEQEIGLSYLTDNLGWVPVYRLELNGKDKGRLSLRAEIANDAENLGNTELRLAVGIPNFAFANRLSVLMNFRNEVFNYANLDNNSSFRGNTFSQSNSYQFMHDLNPDARYDSATPDAPNQFTGSQAEDYFFYSIHPGDFPKSSRYQVPVFETDVATTHYYESILPVATEYRYNTSQNGEAKIEEKQPVFHYVEFKNKEKYPWTAGAVNLLSLSSAGLQPVSQDLLPYTAPDGNCKVKIAQAPDIKVTEVEGNLSRKENALVYFGNEYHLAKIEAQIAVVNYKNEPITLKIRRAIEGKPSESDQTWKILQQEATLRVNPAFTAEWTLELKPGEERKWKYTYEVYVRH